MSREIDALIAEHVMGLEPIWGVDLSTTPLFDWSEELNSKGAMRPAKEYSTDIAAAWEVLNRVSKFNIVETFPGGAKVSVSKGLDMYQGLADTPAMAICLASLKSKGIDVE